MFNYTEFTLNLFATSTRMYRPLDILQRLLYEYIRQSESWFFCYRHHKLDAKRLIKLINEQENILPVLNEIACDKDFNPNGEFANLLKTFFMFYPCHKSQLSEAARAKFSEVYLPVNVERAVQQILQYVNDRNDSKDVLNYPIQKILINLTRFSALVPKKTVPALIVAIFTLIDDKFFCEHVCAALVKFDWALTASDKHTIMTKMSNHRFSMQHSMYQGSLAKAFKALQPVILESDKQSVVSIMESNLILNVRNYDYGGFEDAESRLLVLVDYPTLITAYNKKSATEQLLYELVKPRHPMDRSNVGWIRA